MQTVYLCLQLGNVSLIMSVMLWLIFHSKSTLKSIMLSSFFSHQQFTDPSFSAAWLSHQHINVSLCLIWLHWYHLQEQSPDSKQYKHLQRFNIKHTLHRLRGKSCHFLRIMCSKCRLSLCPSAQLWSLKFSAHGLRCGSWAVKFFLGYKIVDQRSSDGCQTPTNTWSCVFKVISRNIKPDNPRSHSSVFTILQSVYLAGEGMRG